MLTWSYKKALPTARVFSASAYVAGKWHVIGGTPSLAVHEAYEPATDLWYRLAPPTIGRYWASAAACRGKIYLIGGIDSNGNGVAQVEIYDPATDSWSSGPQTTYLYGHSAVGHEEQAKVYIFGGKFHSSGGNNGTLTGPSGGKGVVWPINRPLRGGPGSPGGANDVAQANVYTIDIATNSVDKVGTLFQASAFMGATRVGNSFYLAGSAGAQQWNVGNSASPINGAPAFNDWPNAATTDRVVLFMAGGTWDQVQNSVTVTNQVAKYDTILGTWSTETPLNTARLGAASCAIDASRQAEPSLTYQTSGQATVVINDVAYVVGGNAQNTIQIFDPLAAFVQQVTLPMTLTNISACALTTDIYIMGAVGNTAYFFVYDTLQNIFTQLAPYVGNAQLGGALIECGGYLYFVQNGSNISTRVQKYDPNGQSWTAMGNQFPFTGATDLVGDSISSTQLIVFAGDTPYLLDTSSGGWGTKTSAGLTNPKFKVANYNNGFQCATFDAKHWTYDWVNDIWTYESDLLLNRTGVTPAAFSYATYFMGGTPNTSNQGNNESWTGASGVAVYIGGGEVPTATYEASVESQASSLVAGQHKLNRVDYKTHAHYWDDDFLWY